MIIICTCGTHFYTFYSVKSVAIRNQSRVFRKTGSFSQQRLKLLVEEKTNHLSPIDLLRSSVRLFKILTLLDYECIDCQPSLESWHRFQGICKKLS